jgi:hypothetical protein
MKRTIVGGILSAFLLGRNLLPGGPRAAKRIDRYPNLCDSIPSVGAGTERKRTDKENAK